MRHTPYRDFSLFLLFSPDPPGGLPNPPDPEPIPARPPANGHGHEHPAEIACGFCGSSLTTVRGEVLKLGARAKTLRDSEHEIERLTRTVEEQKQEIASLRARLTPAPPTDKPFWQL